MNMVKIIEFMMPAESGYFEVFRKYCGHRAGE